MSDTAKIVVVNAPAGTIVKPAILKWAEQRGTKNPENLKEHFSSWDDWTSGTDQPSLEQVRKIADYTNLPFGLFMLNEPPIDELPIPDFRSGRGNTTNPLATPSRNLLDVIMQSQRRQSWYEDYLAAVGADVPLEFVGSARGLKVTEAAEKIRKQLDYSVSTRAKFNKPDDARSYLVRAFEALGGLVVITSMVGNNTSRPLDHDEFRGFSVQSRLAPFVFVNSHNESFNAQVFSLLHEFAHIWRGESGVSGSSEDNEISRDPRESYTIETARKGDNHDDIERWCNLVASEVAVPSNHLHKEFNPNNADFTGEIKRLASIYKCSTLVVMIRLRELNLVPWKGFSTKYTAELQRLQEVSTETRSGGGNFYLTQRFRIGETLSHAVIRDLRQGRTAPAGALRLLGFRDTAIMDKYAQDYLKEL